MRQRITGLPDGMQAYLEMNPIGQIMKDKGLTSDGSVQAFHTNNVLRRIQKYMPYRYGLTIKLTIVQTDINKPEIVTDAPYARYLFHGMKMVGKAPKRLTSTPLNYTKTKNPQAGPRWDRALSINEGAALARELQRYINSRR